MQDPRGVTPVVVFVTGTGGEITRGPWFLEEEAVTSNFKRALRRYVDLPTNIGPASHGAAGESESTASSAATGRILRGF